MKLNMIETVHSLVLAPSSVMIVRNVTALKSSLLKGQFPSIGDRAVKGVMQLLLLANYYVVFDQ